VPRTAVQRFGSFIIGTVCVAGGLMAAAASFRVKSSSPHVPLVFSFFVVVWALGIAWFGIWLGGRLLAGSFRHSQIAKGESKRQGR
jgi:hypothetical protein